MADTVTRLCPRFIFLQTEIDIEVVFGADCRFDFRHIDCYFFLLVRADIHLGPVEFTFLDDFAVFLDFPICIQEIAEVLEKVAAFNFNLSLSGIDIMDAHLSILVFDFPHFWLQGAIGEYETVCAEIVVVLPVAPHTTKLKVGGSLMAQTLVDKVPNKATERARVAVEGIHIFL